MTTQPPVPDGGESRSDTVLMVYPGMYLRTDGRHMRWVRVHEATVMPPDSADGWVKRAASAGVKVTPMPLADAIGREAAHQRRNAAYRED